MMNKTRMIDQSSSPVPSSRHCKKPSYTLAAALPIRADTKRSQTKAMTHNLVNTKTSTTASLSLAVEDRRQTDEREAKNLSRQIVSFCRQAQIHFVDDQFPPTDLSLGAVAPLDRQHLQWLRISHISSSSRADLSLTWSVYSSPKPSDIQQGALGDCWLMAGLALITERPEMLDHILLTKKVNSEGVYLVRLCHNGLWKTVLVDDCFPCTQANQLAFTQANRRQLFVPLIEKACAKLFGSYADLIGGRTEEGLQLLTGAPCDHIDLNPVDSTVDGDLVWAKLLSACESQLIIGASTGRSDIGEEEYARHHLHGNHAFSVLAAYSLESIAMQFVLVRDPHARASYVDDLLNPVISRKLNSIHPHSQSSGAFWISWPKFLRLFNSITISTYASDYYDVREVARFTRSATQSIPTFHFYVSKTSLVNISLIYHRENRRVRHTHTQSFVLCNIDQRTNREVGTTHRILCTSRGASTHWIGSLRPGLYVLIPFSTSFWAEENQSVQDYTLVIHSKVQIDLQVINEPVTLLADCLIATMLERSKNISKEKSHNFYISTMEYDFTAFIAENLSSTEYLNMSIDMDDSVRIRHSRRSLITHDSIPPRHRQILFLIEWANEYGQKAKMEYSFLSRLTSTVTPSLPQVFHHQNDFHSFRPF